jgi:hypothetical protein
MVEGKIGPIELDHTELYDDNTISVSGEENFTIICTNRQARQIMGLAAYTSDKEQIGYLNIHTSNSSWGLVWIDSSLGLSSNEDITHRGWYVITGVEPTTDLGCDYVHLEVTAEKLSGYEYDYLVMDYTPGVNDGTTIDHGYTDNSANYILNEDFSDFDTSTVWTAVQNQAATTPLATPIGGDLELWGYGETAGTGGYVWSQTQATHTGPSDGLTLEWGMSILTTPSSSWSTAAAFFTNNSRSTDAWSFNDTIYCTMSANSSGGYMYRVFGINSLGTWSKLVPDTVCATPGTGWKMVWSSNNNITLSVDVGSGYVEKYKGHPQISTYTPHYAGFMMNTATTGLAQARFTELKIYNYDTVEDAFDNVVVLPCTTPVTSADFSRYGEDGLIPCYTNPTAPLYFWQDADNYYNGSVKGWNSNYTDTTPQLITSTEEVLDSAKFSVDNTLIKLTTSNTATTPVLFSVYASPAGWTDLQILNPGTINLLKPLHIGPERQTYQINDTKWTMQRGKQHIMVEHPSTPITYTRKDYYSHDGGVTTTPEADADISMATTYYANVYNDADVERFQIVQTEPVTIKSDSIPAASITGLGYYDNSESSSSKNYYSTLAGEFMKQPYQKINLRMV